MEPNLDVNEGTYQKNGEGRNAEAGYGMKNCKCNADNREELRVADIKTVIRITVEGNACNI
jgi:hypothetical protein